MTGAELRAIRYKLCGTDKYAAAAFAGGLRYGTATSTEQSLWVMMYKLEKMDVVPGPTARLAEIYGYCGHMWEHLK